MSELQNIVGVRCGTNPGGAYRVWAIPADQIDGYFPIESDIEQSLLSAFPTLKNNTTVVEFFATPKTLKTDQNLTGNKNHQSWEQLAELKIAGYNAQQCAAIEKLLNVDIILIVEFFDGLIICLGSATLGLEVEVSHTSGATATDRREWTIKAKNSGYMHGYLPFASNVKFPSQIRWEEYSSDFASDFANDG